MGESSGNIFTPAGQQRFYPADKPVLTLAILRAYLQRFAVLHAPRTQSKRFTWCRTVATEADLDGIGAIDPHLLYVCSEPFAERVLNLDASAFALVVVRDGQVPAALHGFRNRIIVISSTDRMYYLASEVQSLFVNLLLWEHQLDRVVAERGSLAQFLDVGARALGTFLAITDTGFNLVACAEGTQPPAGTFRQLRAMGCYPPDAIGFLEREILPQCRGANRPVLDRSRTLAEADVVHFPAFYDGDYFFHLAVPCTSELPPEAVVDLVGLLSARLLDLYGTFWVDLMRFEAPWHKVLTNYLTGEPMDAEYAQVQMGRTNLPNAAWLKLYAIDLSGIASPTERSAVAAAARRINEGRCYPFAFEGTLLVLCHSPVGHAGGVRDLASEEETLAGLPNAGLLRVGVSSAFTRVEDLRQAFEQAKLALHFLPAINAEFALACRERTSQSIAFEMALPYYKTAVLMREDPFARTFTENSVVKLLAAEDAETGSEHVKLLWTYLCAERNATLASKRLHMHRNTVLYNIEKIERRFGVDLSDSVVRHCLVDEVRFYLLTDGFAHPIDFDALLTVHEHPERRFS